MEKTMKEVALTLGDLYILVRRSQNVRIIRQALFNLSFVVLSIAICSWAHPVWAIWDVHEAILGQFIIHGRFGPGNSQNFRDISAVDDFWLWMDKVLWPTLFPLDAAGMTSVRRCNRPLRALRFRQVRVMPQPCASPLSQAPESAKHPSASICWPDFQEAAQSDVPLQARRSWLEAPAVSEVFQTELPSRAGDLERGNAYGTHAFTMDVPFKCHVEDVTSGGSAGRTRCSELVGVLQQHAWIDEGTRAVDLEMNLRNANHELWTYLRFHFDFLAAGLVHPTVNMQSLQLWPHSKKSNGALSIVTELLLAVLFGLHTALEAAAAWRHGVLRYVKHKGNLVRLASILTLGSGIMCWILYITESREGLDIDDSEFRDMLPLIHRLDVALGFIGVAVCLSCFSLLEVVRIYEPSAVFFCAVQEASAQVGQLLGALMLCTAGFALAGHWLFGTSLGGTSSGPSASFSTAWASLSALVRSLYGGLDGAHPAAGRDDFLATQLAVYALLWMVLVVTVFAGFLVAALIDGQRRARVRNEQIECWCTELSRESPTAARPPLCSPLPSLSGAFGPCLRIPQASQVRPILDRIDIGILLARIDAAIQDSRSNKAPPLLGLEALKELLGGNEGEARLLLMSLCPERDDASCGADVAAGQGANAQDAAVNPSDSHLLPRDAATPVVPPVAAVAVTPSTGHTHWPPRVCVQAVHAAKAYMLTLSDQVSALTLQVRRLTHQAGAEAPENGVAPRSTSRQQPVQGEKRHKDDDDDWQDQSVGMREECGSNGVFSHPDMDGSWNEDPLSGRIVPYEVVKPPY